MQKFISLERKKSEIRYPNLSTILMVEEFLKKHRAAPLKIIEIKEKLPRGIMHQTLLIILQYLWQSSKIIYGPRGIQWVYMPPEHIKKMLKGTLQI